MTTSLTQRGRCPAYGAIAQAGIMIPAWANYEVLLERADLATAGAGGRPLRIVRHTDGRTLFAGMPAPTCQLITSVAQSACDELNCSDL